MKAQQALRLTGSDAARAVFERREGRPWFRADWAPAIFVHFEVPEAALQPSVPFPLDCRDGKAYVTLVAFSFFNFRVRGLGKPGAWFCHPFLATRFLNVRTYVRGREGPGIYFLTEFLSNRLTVPLGPPSFGLPYRHGRLAYEHDAELSEFRADICAGDVSFGFRGLRRSAPWATSPADSQSEFLLERYVAYTWHRGRPGYFRIWHEPWWRGDCAVTWQRPLPENLGPWVAEAAYANAHLSPGVKDVWLGRPRRA